MNKFDLVLSAVLGEKKLEIIKFICEVADNDNFVRESVLSICEKTNSSKPTAINTLKFLESKGALKKLKNGLYLLTPKKIDE